MKLKTTIIGLLMLLAIVSIVLNVILLINAKYLNDTDIKYTSVDMVRAYQDGFFLGNNSCKYGEIKMVRR